MLLIEPTSGFIRLPHFQPNRASNLALSTFQKFGEQLAGYPASPLAGRNDNVFDLPFVFYGSRTQESAQTSIFFGDQDDTSTHSYLILLFSPVCGARCFLL